MRTVKTVTAAKRSKKIMNDRIFKCNKAFAEKLPLLCLSLACAAALSLASCAKPPEESDRELVTEGEFLPATDEGASSELGKRHADYSEKLSLAFKDTPEQSGDAFAYIEENGGATVTDYIGTDSVVLIPSEINGLPVAKIAEGAFSGKGVRAVSVPDSVKRIEDGAFADSDGLVTLRLPFVGDGEDNGFFGSVFGAKDHDENPVKLPASLDVVIIGEGVTEIQENAFAGCKGVGAISLPDSVESIGKFAFFECADLVAISLGDGVKSIGSYAFGKCSSLYSVSLEGALEIGEGALLGAASINSVALPFVGGSAEENTHLGYIFGAETADFNDEFVPESLRSVTLLEGCKAIGDRAFASCKYITSVTLPEGIEAIGVRAFYACRSLVEISLPDSAREIGDDAFFACEALRSVSLGEGLLRIGMQAFYRCSSLESIALPEGVTEIKASTFYNCSSLESVELGGVTAVGRDAFWGCDSLKITNTDKLLSVANGNDALYPSEQDTAEK